LPHFEDFDPSQEGPKLPPDVPDRGAWIAVFAIAQILIGGLALLLMPLGVIGQVLAARMSGAGLSSTKLAGMVMGTGLYLLVGGVMIGCGIGAVRRRRWARALALVYSVIWLLGGVVGMVWMGLIMPSIASGTAAPGGARMPVILRALIVVISLGVGVVLYLALPGAIAFFHSRPSVKANFDCFDPGPDWSDACPLPVLGLSICMLLMALGALGSAVTGAMLFGKMVTGLPAAALALGSVGMAGLIAWGLFRIREAAWWGALAWVLFWFSSWTVTMVSMTPEEFYSTLEMGEAERQATQVVAGAWWAIPWMTAAIGAAAVGYLLWVRRFFVKTANAASGDA
jgi:hypothetical protein